MPLSVDPGPTTTVLMSSADPAPAGAPVVLTASVSGTNGAPTGTVTFRDGTTVLGDVPLAAGTASLTTSTLDPGSPHDHRRLLR